MTYPHRCTLPFVIDHQIPAGTRVHTELFGQGRVVREYVMPADARQDAWGFYSHPGARIYVVRFDSGKAVAIGAEELTGSVLY